jgi:hypothetical protein
MSRVCVGSCVTCLACVYRILCHVSRVCVGSCVTCLACVYRILCHVSRVCVGSCVTCLVCAGSCVSSVLCSILPRAWWEGFCVSCLVCAGTCSTCKLGAQRDWQVQNPEPRGCCLPGFYVTYICNVCRILCPKVSIKLEDPAGRQRLLATPTRQTIATPLISSQLKGEYTRILVVLVKIIPYQIVPIHRASSQQHSSL